ncbi:hypothetical protein JCM11251_003927 [Rhodosporidiobolus azoricus]
MSSPKPADPPAVDDAPANSPPPSTAADDTNPASVDAAPMYTEGSSSNDLPPSPPADEPATVGMEETATAPAAETNGDAVVKDATPARASPSTNKRAASAAPEPVEEKKEEETEEQRAEKRRRLDKVKAESKARGNRMFGVMLGTLKRAKAQVSTVNKTDAGRKRAEVDEKLQEKLGKERREAMEKEGREREIKDLKWEVQRREEEIASADAIYRTRHNAKLDLAGFLCTTFTLPPSSTKPSVSSTDPSNPHSSTSLSIPPAFLPNLPHAMTLQNPSSSSNPSTSSAARPIYYLPRRLLPSQEDRIESQIDAVKSAMRKEREAWEEEKREKREEMGKKRERLEELQGQVERREREERQRRRREQEDRLDREEEGRRRERTHTREPSVAGMDVDRDRDRDRDGARNGSRPPVPVREERPEVDDDDVAMKEDKVGSGAAPELSINGAAAQKAAEEELEY